MELEVSFNPATARWVIFGAGAVLILLVWFTGDSEWAFWRRWDRPNDYSASDRSHDRPHSYKESDLEGGVRRFWMMVLGVVLATLGLFGGRLLDALGISVVQN
jgi:hypothetical protein